MKKLFILITLILSFNAMALDGEQIKALEAEGFSPADIETIANVIFDRDTGTTRPRKNGVVKFYNEAKGLGIVFTQDGTYLPFDASVELGMNDLVSYEVQEGKKGLNAVNVKKVIAIQDEPRGFSSLIR